MATCPVDPTAHAIHHCLLWGYRWKVRGEVEGGVVYCVFKIVQNASFINCLWFSRVVKSTVCDGLKRQKTEFYS